MTIPKLKRRRTWPAILAGFVVLAAWLASPLAGTDNVPTPDVPPGFSETIEVRVINVEAVVTDRSGSRVYGLTPDDFRLEVNGREIPVEYFSEIRGGDLVEKQGDVSRTLPGVAPGEPVRTNHLIFIDDYFSIERNRNEVLDEIEKDLDRMREQDYIAIVAFDGKQTTMITSWTNDEAEIKRALQQARERATYGLQRYAELRTSDRERELTDDAFFGPLYDFRLTPLERDYARRLASQLDRVTTAITATLQGFAAPPGRKAALLLSGGWPFSPAEYTVSTYYSTFEDVARSTFDPVLRGRAELYDPVANTANLLGYTLYTVDLPGLSPLENNEIDAERAAPRPVGAITLDREQGTEHTLRFLADETGGKPLLNGERTDALAAVTRDTRSYYWLGFSARRVADGERHKIDIEVEQPGLRVRARKDFVDLTRDSELDMMIKSSLMFGQPSANSPLILQLGSPESPDKKKVKLPLKVGIPTDAIFITEQGDRYRGQLELRIGAMGPEGALSKTASETVTIDEPRAPEPGETFWYETTVQLRSNTDRLAVSVYDAGTGKVLSSLRQLDIGS